VGPTTTRDRRRFGRGPYLLGLERNPDPAYAWPQDGAEFPYNVPAVAALPALDLSTPVTLLAGDNGAGKSTIVEAIAEAVGFGAEGGELERPRRPSSLPRPVLEQRLLPVTTPFKPRCGYFLRAESFFNVARYVDEATDPFAPDLSLYGGRPLHEQSHGQSFLALAANRFGGEGIFVLDEPEAALSVSGALALLAIVARAARGGAQFIIATHSPILLACPGARIYELTETGAAPCAYDDLDAVRLTRGFLDAPERYLRAVLDE
jgi:predicted ATPase